MGGPKFKSPKSLAHYAHNLKAWENGGWLYIRGDEISLDTPCLLQDWDERDLTEEEQDELDVVLSKQGYRAFLEWSLLSEIVSNLGAQKPDFDDIWLLRAIGYYWKFDAFIDCERTD